MKTFTAKPATIECNWYVVDAAGRTLGRLASGIAHRLRGKHKAEYTPHVNMGDYIIVLNAKKNSGYWKKKFQKSLLSSHWIYWWA